MKEAVAIGLGVVGLLVVGGVAYAASSSSSSGAAATGASGGSSGTTGAGAGGSSGSAGAAAPSSLPAGSTQGLTGSHSTPSGWELDITASNVSGLIYYAFFGDVIRVSLPAGAHWRRITTAGTPPALSPPSGTDDWVFQFVESFEYTLAYTDVAGVDVTSVIDFQVGATFAKTTHLTTGDYVILAVTASDFQSAFATLSGALSTSLATPGSADAVLAQQGETINTASAALQAAQGKSVPLSTAEVLTLFFAMGPWQASFGMDVRTFLPFPSGTPLPSWWPSDDTAAATEHHVLYRYIGPGVDVSALPFPVTAWKRTA